MKEAYLDNLIKQFMNARGINDFDINDKKQLEEFRAWLCEINSIYNDFVYFLQIQGIELNSKDCAEIGKGKCDSICLPYESTLITPYASTLNADDRDRIIEGKMFVDYSLPALQTQDAISYLPYSKVRTYFTYNPYNFYDLRNWDKLNNVGAANIIVGMLGHTYDKDKDKKIDLLIQLKKALLNGVKFAYTEYRDIYLSVVTTEKNFKIDSNYYKEFEKKDYSGVRFVDEWLKETSNEKQKKLK